MSTGGLWTPLSSRATLFHLCTPRRWPGGWVTPGCFAFYLLFWFQQWCRGDPRCVEREGGVCLAPRLPAWGCAAGSTCDPQPAAPSPVTIFPHIVPSCPLGGGGHNLPLLFLSECPSFSVCFSVQVPTLYFLIHTWEEFSCCQDSGWQSPELLITSEKVQVSDPLPHLTKDQPPLY